MSGKRIEPCDKDYLSATSYAAFVLGRVKNGGVWGAVRRIYKKIRKYTLLTAIIRTLAAIVSLLEKSAILLLLFTGALLLLPVIAVAGAALVAVNAVGYFKMKGSVGAWLSEAENITVYVTSDRFYPALKRRGGAVRGDGRGERSAEPLFVRCAACEAGEYRHPVIVVCSDPFMVAKWAGFNLLTVKCDYFFILRRYFFKDKNVTYVVLS